MINGTINLEDLTITFKQNRDLTITCTVKDFVRAPITLTVPGPDFFLALAIAGMPDYKADYPDAGSVQPTNELLRWILP